MALIGLAFSLDALAARTDGAGVVWVVTRGASGDALNRMLHTAGAGGKGGDARLVNAWAGGRVVQLQVSSMREMQVPAGAAWAAFRLPQMMFSLPGCG